MFSSLRGRVIVSCAVAIAVAVGVVTYVRSAEVAAPRVVAATCHWNGDRVRVSITVYNPNSSAEPVVIVPTYQLETGGVQNAHSTLTAWSGSVAGGLMAGHSFDRRRTTNPPQGYDWRVGERIVRCQPSAYIPSGSPESD